MRVGWPDLPNRLARPLKRQTAGQDSAPPDAPCPCNHDVASLSGSEKARSPESRRAGHSGLSSGTLRPVPCAWEPLWGLGAAASTWLHVCRPRPLPLVPFQHFSSVKGSSLILPKVPCSGECFSYVGKEAIFGFGSTGLGSHPFPLGPCGPPTSGCSPWAVLQPDCHARGPSRVTTRWLCLCVFTCSAPRCHGTHLGAFEDPATHHVRGVEWLFRCTGHPQR